MIKRFNQIVTYNLLVFLALGNLSIVIRCYNHEVTPLFATLLAAVIISVLILRSFDRYAEESIVVLTVYIISLILIHHVVNSHEYLIGTDNQAEYYFANKVINSGKWLPTSPQHNYNCVLSITILPAVIVLLTNLSLLQVLKYLIPSLYALIPVILYKMYCQIMQNRHEACMSVFLFMYSFSYFLIVATIYKQMIAEIFISLLLYILLKIDKHRMRIHVILTVLIFGLVTSHYSSAYVYLIISIETLTVYMFAKILFRLKNWKTSHLDKKLYIGTFTFTYMILINLWYLSMGTNVFLDIILIAQNALFNIREFLNPVYTQGVQILLREVSVSERVLKYLYMFSLVMMGVGVIYKIRNVFTGVNSSPPSAQNTLFIIIAFSGFITFLEFSIIPFLGASINLDRIYHLTSFLLSPMFLVGLSVVLQLVKVILEKLGKILKANIHFNSSFLLRFFLMFFVIFAAFNLGIPQEVFNRFNSHGESFSYALNVNLDRPSANRGEYTALTWVTIHATNDTKMFSDYYGWEITATYYRKDIPRHPDTYKELADSLIFLRSYNIKTKSIITLITVHAVRTITYIEIDETFFSTQPIVYDNSKAKIYLTSDDIKDYEFLLYLLKIGDN